MDIAEMLMRSGSDTSAREVQGMKHDLMGSQGSGVEALGAPDSPSTANLGQTIVSLVLTGYGGSVAVRLWDGQLAAGSHNASCTVVFREPWVLRSLVLQRDLMRLAEIHLAGGVEVEGGLEALFDLGAYLTQLRLPLTTRLHLVSCALQLPRKSRKSPEYKIRKVSTPHRNSRASISYHYDLGNDFYGLWLDPEYVYSCAYFRHPDQPLVEAQREKLDLICRKLRLAPGQTLLDIGCGWGALALWAARHYGVRVHGITLSLQQHELAGERVRVAGLADKICLELLDYRELSDSKQYDRIVSVGMFEHIGVRNFRRYFGTVQKLLKPGGLFLNHGITSSTGWQRTPLTRFINRYIFPDGELARLSVVTGAMERSGFEVLDTESLRPHYTLTLRRWAKALEDNRAAAIDVTSTETYKLWRLYLAGSAYYFHEGSIGVYQILAGHVGGTPSVPLRRDDLYAMREV